MDLAGKHKHSSRFIPDPCHCKLWQQKRLTDHFFYGSVRLLTVYHEHKIARSKVMPVRYQGDLQRCPSSSKSQLHSAVIWDPSRQFYHETAGQSVIGISDMRVSGRQWAEATLPLPYPAIPCPPRVKTRTTKRHTPRQQVMSQIVNLKLQLFDEKCQIY
jgi:hypothetical protein